MERGLCSWGGCRREKLTGDVKESDFVLSGQLREWIIRRMASCVSSLILSYLPVREYPSASNDNARLGMVIWLEIIHAVSCGSA
jgi:hypothetical protein